MRILTGIVFFSNILIWLGRTVLGFLFGTWIIGLPVLLGFIGFIIGWNLSWGIAVSPADHFFQPAWDVFKTKMKWANGIGIAVGIFSLIIAGQFL